MTKKGGRKWRLVLTLLQLVVGSANNQLFANNLFLSNGLLTGQNTTDHFVVVQFDINWENSWRDGINWDACWVFVKYKAWNRDWRHATLNIAGHTAPIGCVITTPADGKGVFIYRNANGIGNVTYNGTQLRWNYGADGVADTDQVMVKVIAIEMVYVPTGEFTVGDGSSDANQFSLTLINTPNAVQSGGYPAGQTPPSNGSWPNGYSAFYCMKYEVTQEQYRDFLNMLTYTQQLARTAVLPESSPGTRAMTSGQSFRNGIEIETSGGSPATPAIYACNLNHDATYNASDDGQNIACNFLSWADGAAYSDFAGLRPMTELEFEKACRGSLASVADEYAWGTRNISGAAGVINGGQSSEQATNPGANCNYDGITQGPMRVGAFAGPATNREMAGATYYGMMELSGNQYERAVTIGHAVGRGFMGSDGDGQLSANGEATNSDWPPRTALGSGFRGGGWNATASNSRVSDRFIAVTTGPNRTDNDGFRCVRFAP